MDVRRNAFGQNNKHRTKEQKRLNIVHTFNTIKSLNIKKDFKLKDVKNLAKLLQVSERTSKKFLDSYKAGTMDELIMGKSTRQKFVRNDWIVRFSVFVKDPSISRSCPGQEKVCIGRKQFMPKFLLKVSKKSAIEYFLLD